MGPLREYAKLAWLYSTNYTNRCDLGTAHTKKIGWPSGLRPSARPILTHPATFGPAGQTRVSFLLKPTCILDSTPQHTAPSCPTSLYPTPLSILTLVTWVERTQAGLWPNSACRLAVGPLALGQTNPNSPGFACRWRLRLALRAKQESYSIETHPVSLRIGYRVQGKSQLLFFFLK